MNQKPIKVTDMALEILHGCIHRCYGCNVNRTEQDGFLPGDVERLRLFCEDIELNNSALVNLEIGPTDFMSSTNTIQVVTDAIPIMDKFQAIVFQSTFTATEADIREWAEKMRPLLKGRKIKFKVPVDPRHWKKVKYLQGVMDKIKLFIELLPETTYLKTYALINIKEYVDVGEDPLAVFQMLVSDPLKYTPHVDMVITEGRLPLTDLNNREKLRSAFLHHSKLHVSDLLTPDVRKTLNIGNYFKESRRQYNRDKYGQVYDDADFTYKNGRIYIPVFASENVTIFDESLAFPKDAEWTVATAMQLNAKLLTEQLQYASTTTECLECEFVSSCILNRILQAMKLVRAKDCIVPKEEFERSRNLDVW